MKTLPVVILLFTVTCAFSQNGKIVVKNPEANSEGQTTFIFEPANGIYLPEDLQVNLSCSDFRKKTIPLVKKGSGYEFSMKLPVSSTVLFFTITDNKQNTVDDNSGKGYVVYLKDASEEGFEQTLLEKIKSAGMASYYLKLDYDEQDILDAYESLFTSFPNMKNGSNYANYLIIKFRRNKEETRPELITFVEQMEGKDDEESLTAAYTIYRTLDMQDEVDKVAEEAMEKYPAGDIAKINFTRNYFNVQERDETFIANKIDEYIRQFGDPMDPNLDFLYQELFMKYLEKKDTLSIAKYKNQITDRNFWVSIYNNYAWRATGGDLTSPGKDLDFASQISKKSMDLVEYMMDHPEENEAGNDLDELYRMCADTYALILYKLKKYEQAFQYQQEILNALGDEWYTPGKERYAAFAEKAKGPEFARDYLEKQLLAGTDSKVMMEQLQNIYAELNLPEDKLDNLKKQYKESVAQKDREEIIKEFGDTIAMDFTLPNLEGGNVTLSDYNGKVVVLDFWATWCGPCISSFPHMQELVKQFEDENVEFLFINSWETQEPDKVKEKVIDFLDEKDYNFNVLFDFNDNVITAYKVPGIPSRFLIDRKGNLRAIVRYSDDLAAMINEELE